MKPEAVKKLFETAMREMCVEGTAECIDKRDPNAQFQKSPVEVVRVRFGDSERSQEFDVEESWTLGLANFVLMSLYVDYLVGAEHEQDEDRISRFLDRKGTQRGIALAWPPIQEEL